MNRWKREFQKARSLFKLGLISSIVMLFPALVLSLLLTKAGRGGYSVFLLLIILLSIAFFSYLLIKCKD